MNESPSKQQPTQNNNILFNISGFLDYDDHCFYDLIDIDVDNDENTFDPNITGEKPITEMNLSFSFANSNNKGDNQPSLIKKNKSTRGRKKKVTVDSPKHDNSQILLKYDKLTLKQFMEYLNIKINKRKQTKVSKETLLYMYDHLQQHLQMSPLSRDDKRDKNRILRKLYLYSKEIIKCFETYPETYLEPIIMFSGIKFFKRYKNFTKVNDLKKALNI